jgi:hypothetical protein
MKMLAVLVLAFAAIAFSDRAEAQSDCIHRYVMDSQGGFCGSCSAGYPPTMTPSIFAQRKKFYVVCQSCGVPCQTRPSIAQPAAACAAADPQGNHLEGALLIGLVDPQNAAGFAQLVSHAPEIALVLASYAVEDGLAPQLDMRSQQSYLDKIPSSELVATLLNGVDPGPSAIASGSEDLPAGTTLRVDARTELLANGHGRITLTSSIFENKSQKIVRTLHEYSVELVEIPGKHLSVRQYLRHQASLHHVAAIERIL